MKKPPVRMRRPAASPAALRPLSLRFFEKSGALAIDRLAAELGMSKSDLAGTAGLGREALYKTQRARAPRTQARMREIVEVLGRIERWAGGPSQALAWYRAQPIPAFGGRTAESLVKSGQAGALRDYLDSIALGGFA